MRFARNKIVVAALVAGAFTMIFGATWLQGNKPASPIGPNHPQTSLPVQTQSPNPAAPQSTKPAAGQSVVRFSDGGSKQDFLKANNLSPGDLQAVPQLADTYVVNRSEDQLKPVDAQVSEQQRYTALLTPNDTIYQQWYTDKISAPAAWDITTGSSSIIVADIDTGFALNHEDLVGRWAPGGWDFVNNDNDPSAGTDNPTGIGVSHGTVTAGLIGAASNNSKGVASINWGVRILPLQALDDNGGGTTTDVASAIHYAVDQGAKVINMSLGTASPDPIVKAELDYAQSHDVVVVAAAGNCGSPSSYFLNGCSAVGQMVYPANYPQVIAVGATDSDDIRASFSSYGPNLDVVAPGSGTIQTTAWADGNQTSAYTLSISGTSFSSPIVAGLAALYRGYITASSASGTITAITSSADKLSSMTGQSFTNEYGFGRINAAHTLSGASPAPVTPTPPPTPPETTPTPLPEPVQLTHPDGTLIIKPGGAVYLVENSQLRHVLNPPVFVSNYGGEIDSRVKPALFGDLQLSSGSNVDYAEGALLKGSGPAIYAVEINGGSLQKRHIVSLAVYQNLGYDGNSFINVPDSLLPSATGADITEGSRHPNGTLIQAPGALTIYLLENNLKRYVPSPAILRSLHKSDFRFYPGVASDIQLPDGTNVDYAEGTLLKADNSPKIYVVDINGGVVTKRHITSLAIYQTLGYTAADVIDVSASQLPSTDGADIN